MTTYNTKNPLGSSDPRDLYDNAENLDVLTNSREALRNPDRFGVQRKTWHGMERDYEAAESSRDDRFQASQLSRNTVFSDFLQASGYQDLGEYAPGIEITSHNQYVTFNGQPYLLKPSIPVPYTTSGGWTVDDFKLIGDGSIRQDLANPGIGAAMVARGVVAVDSIADLLALPAGQRKEGLRYLVSRYTVGSNENGGAFYWTNSDISTEISDDPEGGYYVAPSDAPTGAEGGWVRFLGTFSSINFPQSAPPGASFHSKTLGRIYFRVAGEWEAADAYLMGMVDSHVQSKDAHGLQDSLLAIGEGAEALGAYPVAIGKDVKTQSSYSVGINNFSNSPFSSLFGRNLSVTVSDTSTQRASIAIGDACVLTDTISFVAIGRTITATGTSGVAIGNGVNVSGENSIGIGRQASAAHSRSAAIGYQAVTTADDQIVLGRSAHTVVIRGNLEVTGTKNFSIPHPDPSKSSTHKLLHTSYEGPTRGGTIYRFRVSVENDSADIALPDYYEHLNEGGDIFVNAVGHFGVGYGEVSGNTLTIHASAPGEYVVMVMAERKDPAAVEGWKGEEVEI